MGGAASPPSATATLIRRNLIQRFPRRRRRRSVLRQRNARRRCRLRRHSARNIQRSAEIDACVPPAINLLEEDASRCRSQMAAQGKRSPEKTSAHQDKIAIRGQACASHARTTTTSRMAAACRIRARLYASAVRILKTEFAYRTRDRRGIVPRATRFSTGPTSMAPIANHRGRQPSARRVRRRERHRTAIAPLAPCHAKASAVRQIAPQAGLGCRHIAVSQSRRQRQRRLARPRSRFRRSRNVRAIRFRPRRASASARMARETLATINVAASSSERDAIMEIRLRLRSGLLRILALAPRRTSISAAKAMTSSAQIWCQHLKVCCRY